MAREPTVESIMPSAPELAALLKERNLMEGLHEQPIGWQGPVTEALPPMQVLAWEGRTYIGLRVGRDIVMREEGELLDAFRRRVALSHGGPGVVAHGLYRRGTR